MAELIKIEQKIPLVKRKKRVAAYARVSVDMEQSMKSLVNQMDYYRSLIQNNPEWEYAGVYADGGFSGTSTDRREKFKGLVSDCEAGKIDLVLVKSISRFARNTVDLLNTVRHLKNIGVEVYFEEQQISSMSNDGELMLTLLAAIAQEEAVTTRQNVLWEVRNRFEQGIPNGHKRCLGYGWDGESYVVVPEEAEIVRRIYQMYLNGQSSVQIAKELREDGVVGICGKPIGQDGIRFILDNENYTGCLLLQKRYSPSIGKRARNHGEAMQYRVEEDHEPIIDRETFEAVQTLRKRRAGEMPEKEITSFSGLLKCGYCGHAVCRRWKRNEIIWVCNAVDHKGKGCCEGSRYLPETELCQAAADVLGKDYEETIREDVREIIVYDDRLEFHLTNDRIKIWHRHFSSSAHGRGCFSGKIYCGECGAVYTREANNQRNYAAWVCRNKRRNNGCGNTLIHESELRRAMNDVIGKSEDIEMEFYMTADKVLVYENRLEFYMKDGEVKIWQRQ